MVRACTMFMIMTYALISASFLVFYRSFVTPTRSDSFPLIV